MAVDHIKKINEVVGLGKAFINGIKELQGSGIETEIQIDSHSGHAVVITYPAISAKPLPVKAVVTFPTPEKVVAHRDKPITEVITKSVSPVPEK